MPAEVSEGKSTSVPPTVAPAVAAMPTPVSLPPDESVTHRCANCLAPLAGPFCSLCGQHVADYHRSLWRFVADFFDNAFCWDNKLWRTLGPLLKRPGWLTQEFMAGRRVRYVHPLRLFLFTSAICLTVLQYTHRDAKVRVRTNDKTPAHPGITAHFGTGDKDEDDDADKKAAPAPTPAVPSPASGPAASPSASPAEPTLSQVFRDTFKPAQDGNPPDGAAAEKLGKRWEALGDDIQKKIESAGGAKAFNDRIANNIQQKLSWMTLAMLPIFALLMRWCYGRNGGYYFTYLVFSLHYHTFLLLFWVAYTSLDAVAGRLNATLFQLPGFLVGLFLLLPPYYLFRALRQMYGQGRSVTAAKVFVIGSLHLLALFAGLGIIDATSFL